MMRAPALDEEKPSCDVAKSGRPVEPIYSWGHMRAIINGGLSGPPIELHVVRHAETIANGRGLISGGSDVSLSTKGRAQAVCLGLRLPSAYEHAWVSGLKRTHETLFLAEKLRFRPLSSTLPRADTRLNERSFGILEGTPRIHIAAYERGDLSYAPARGESYLDLAKRLLSFLIDLRRTVRKECRVMVVSHIGPMRLVTGILRRGYGAKEVLALQYRNAEPEPFTLTSLEWPHFLDEAGVTGDGR